MKRTIKKWLKCFVPYGFFVFREYIRHRGDKGKRVSYGVENPDKTFLVSGYMGGGIFWALLYNLDRMAYALENNYIPVIDWQNYKNQYLEKQSFHKQNAWEYYFEQPCGYTLADIQQSKNVIISSLVADGKIVDYHVIYNETYFSTIRAIGRQYIKFNETTSQYIENEYNTLLKNKGAVLGVLCRGTDYVITKPVGHPVQPSPEEVIHKAKKVMKEKNIHYLYLATEDQDIYESFCREFGDKLLTNKQNRFTKEEIEANLFIAKVKHNRDRDKYFLGLEYLSSVYLLSKCNCFMGGLTRGTIGALLMTEGFEYQYIWELGIYT